MFGLFRRRSSFGQEQRRRPRTASVPVVPCVEELEPRDAPAVDVVTTNADSGAGSLRGTIAAAAPGDTITFASNVTAITLTTGQITIDKSLTITGPGAGALSISGNNSSRIFTLMANGSPTVSISGLTLTGGNTAGAGGAINNVNANLNLVNSVVTGNTSAVSGGGIYNISAGQVYINGTTISNNMATGRGGGGLYSDAGFVTIKNSMITGNVVAGGSSDGGGGLVSRGSSALNMQNSTISGNNVPAKLWGGGLYLAGTGTTLIQNSTISGNQSGYGGGAEVYAASSVSFQNCTIASNTAVGKGYGGGGGLYCNTSTLLLQNCTIANNTATVGSATGGGIKTSGNTVTLQNTLVADNTDSTGANDITRLGGTLNASNSLIQALPAGTINGTNTANITGVAPLLGSLQNNGGTVQTIALMPGSPAIDKGSNAFSPGATDERGPGFNRIINNVIDIGAYEFQPPATVTAVVSSLNPSQFGQAVTFTATVTPTAPGSNALQGTVTFFDESTPLGTAPLVNGVAVLTTTTLPADTHTITAQYNGFTQGDYQFAGSQAMLTQTVNPPPAPPPAPVVGPIFAVGADAGAPPQVNVYDAATGKLLASFYAFAPNFTGGVRVAVANHTDDNIPNILCAAGPGTSPEVRIFDGLTFQLLGDIFAFPQTFSGGVYVASGDVNGDGIDDFVVGAGTGGGPEVRVLDGRSLRLSQQFFAYPVSFGGGVRVAVGDVNGDGKDEVITAAGPGGGPEVKVFNGITGGLLSDFFAFTPTFTGGVYVTVGDLKGTGRAEVIAVAGPGGGPQVNIFGGDGQLQNAFFDTRFGTSPLAIGPASGLRAGTVTVNGRTDLLVAGGPGSLSLVDRFDGPTLALVDEFFAFGPAFLGGVFVGG